MIVSPIPTFTAQCPGAAAKANKTAAHMTDTSPQMTERFMIHSLQKSYRAAPHENYPEQLFPGSLTRGLSTY